MRRFIAGRHIIIWAIAAQMIGEGIYRVIAGANFPTCSTVPLWMQVMVSVVGLVEILLAALLLHPHWLVQKIAAWATILGGCWLIAEGLGLPSMDARQWLLLIVLPVVRFIGLALAERYGDFGRRPKPPTSVAGQSEPLAKEATNA